MKSKDQIICNYIAGYNELNIERMAEDLDEELLFQHISNGAVTMSLTGLQAFKKQAEEAKHYFSARTQHIKSIKHKTNETEVTIEYHAVLAKDFPNGLKKGDVLKLKGRSIFEFKGNKIIRLTDIS